MRGWLCAKCGRSWAPGVPSCEPCNIVASGGERVLFFQMPEPDAEPQKGDGAPTLVPRPPAEKPKPPAPPGFL
jgi:hypothetical protein